MNNFIKAYLIKKIYFSLFLSIVMLSHQGFCAGTSARAAGGPEAPVSQLPHDVAVNVIGFLDAESQAAYDMTFKGARTDIAHAKKINLEDAFRRAVHYKPGFCFLNMREIEYIANQPEWKLIKGDAFEIFKSALKVVPETNILAVKGSSILFPLAEDTARRTIFAYQVHAEELFGDNIITSYAAQGYTFWSLKKVKKSDEKSQGPRRINFQQAIGARYVWGTEIQEGGILPDATGPEAVLNSLTPHVVFSTANLRDEAISRKINAFFNAANTRARAIGSSGGAERYRLWDELLAKAVGVMDVEPQEPLVPGDAFQLSVELDTYHKVSQIRHLIVTTTAAIEGRLKIGDDFLSNFSDLISLDLSRLGNVTEIGRGFLYGCSGLISLDLRGLENVTTIERGFLAGCTGLKSLDLRELENVTTIGRGFLYGCSGLISLDLRPLSKVTTIGEHFLSDCTGLTSLDLRPLSKVTTIGDNFLHNPSYDLSSVKSAIETRTEPTLAEKVKGYIESLKRPESLKVKGDIEPLKGSQSFEYDFSDL